MSYGCHPCGFRVARSRNDRTTTRRYTYMSCRESALGKDRKLWPWLLIFGVARAGVAVAVAVVVAVGEGVPMSPQLPFTLNTKCMFGAPSPAGLLGSGNPQDMLLR